MPLTKEEATKIIETKSEKFDEYLRAKDTEGLSMLFHPKIVILHEDGEEHAIIGREEVKKLYAKYLNAPLKFTKRDTYLDSTHDGKYVVLQGEYTLEGKPGTNHYQQVYQRQEDGDYLILYQRRATSLF